MPQSITENLNREINQVTINAPTWDVMRLAITAARLHNPTGTELTLGQYLTLVRGWVNVLRMGLPTDEGAGPALTGSTAELATAETLRTALAQYQDLLDEKGIKCERVRRAAMHGQALPWYFCLTGLFQRLVAALGFFALAAPGLVLWSPMWKFLKRRERFLLSKGPRWNDSVAEMKMMVCGLVGMAFALGCLGTSVYLSSWKPIALLYYSYVTMRCYEEVGVGMGMGRGHGSWASALGTSLCLCMGLAMQHRV